MAEERYIGIENELISFRDGRRVAFISDDLMCVRREFEKYYNISDNSIRTDTGHGFYVDGCEIEILTPPVAINKGFASRLTDLLMIGRNKVLETTPDLAHTGYSMHWNFSRDARSIPSNYFFRGICVPFSLFGLTPLSVGSNLREKEGRYEVLGDSINNEEQIKAAALLFGAYYMQARDTGLPGCLVPKEQAFSSDREYGYAYPDGRYDYVELESPLCGKRQVQVQQYMEAFHQFLKQCIDALGTEEEIKNLEDFIFDEKKLEFDKFKYFAHIKNQNKKEAGIYLPLETNDTNNPGTILRKNPERMLPLEGRLLGDLLRKNRGKICEMAWSHIKFWGLWDYREPNGRELHGLSEGVDSISRLNLVIQNLQSIASHAEADYQIPAANNLNRDRAQSGSLADNNSLNGISEIYEYASGLNGDKFIPPLTEAEIPAANDLDIYQLNPEKIYRPRDDKFGIPEEKRGTLNSFRNLGNFLKDTGRSFKNQLKKDFKEECFGKVVALSMLPLLCGLVSFGIGSCREKHTTKEQANAIVREYTENSSQAVNSSQTNSQLNSGLENIAENGRENN